MCIIDEEEIPICGRNIMKKDTIAAIATAMSNSGIGIVRISGPESLAIIQKIYKGKKEKNFQIIDTHTIHYGYIVDDEDLWNQEDYVSVIIPTESVTFEII